MYTAAAKADAQRVRPRYRDGRVQIATRKIAIANSQIENARCTVRGRWGTQERWSVVNKQERGLQLDRGGAHIFHVLCGGAALSVRHLCWYEMSRDASKDSLLLVRRVAFAGNGSIRRVRASRGGEELRAQEARKGPALDRAVRLVSEEHNRNSRFEVIPSRAGSAELSGEAAGAHHAGKCDIPWMECAEYTARNSVDLPEDPQDTSRTASAGKERNPSVALNVKNGTEF
ncbi:hypothetical protein FB451DRAFT_1189922 [Mycena latifolia]|nr:hypothetical protein FB451DRAFT_1189922 [Mycena latifolia]